MIILQTPRLTLRHLARDDAAFILELVNEPDWLRYIGDKQVATLDDAVRYIDGPIAMYERLGFGLFLVERKDAGEAVGICGLMKKESLDDVDLGFAILARHRGRGYAFESASATMSHANTILGLSRLVAVTSPDNEASGRLLEKLGFRFERLLRLAPDEDEIRLYAAE